MERRNMDESSVPAQGFTTNGEYSEFLTAGSIQSEPRLGHTLRALMTPLLQHPTAARVGLFRVGPL